MNEAVEEDDDGEMERLLERHCIQLTEHFDCVRIFAVRRKDLDGKENWQAISRGKGNWFTLKGAIDDWVLAQNAQTRRDATRE